MLPKYCSSYQVKPSSKKCKTGYQSVGIECYGGGIWHTWFDRDLTVAGRVLVKVRAGTRYEITLHDSLSSEPIWDLTLPQYNAMFHLNTIYNDIYLR